ncbi:MAG: hypothetical protein H6625_00495 [Bdellovibrionaceae bacterium]|nr:hypothetical protein [Pseudobdellovibrionaceae bacterium]
MKKILVVLGLSMLGVSVHAGKSTVILNESNGGRVIVESVKNDDGLASLTFFSCTNQTNIKTIDVDLDQCDVMLEGKTFTLLDVVTAIKRNYDRSPLTYFVQDTYFAMRQATKFALKNPVDGHKDTTYMGSGNSYGFASDPAWLLNSIERAITDGDAEKPGFIDKVYFEGARDGLTALLLFADK